MRYSYLFTCIIVLVACTNNRTNNDNEIFVDFKKCDTNGVDSINQFNYSNYLDTVVYVPLETTDECIMGKAIDIHFVNDRLFISDAKNVFVFSKDGKYLSKVSNFGRGRGEYLSLTNFDVNPTNNEISIYDIGNRMVHVYSINGIFLRNVRIEGVPRDFCVTSNGNYLFYTPDEMIDNYRGVWQTDSKGIFINQPLVLSGHSKKVMLTNNNLIHINNEKVGLNGPMGFDYIYHIKSDTSSIAYQINTNTKIARRVLKDDNADKTMDQEWYSLFHYSEVDRLVSFSIQDVNGKEMDVMYDKKTGKVYTQINFGYEGCPFQFGDKLPFYVYVTRSDYGVSLGIIDAPDMMRFPEYQKKIAPNCTNESNPIVVLYYFKK